MNIKEFLAPADVLADFAASGKVGLLQGLAQRASGKLKLPAELITSALFSEKNSDRLARVAELQSRMRASRVSTSRSVSWCVSGSRSILMRLMTGRLI